MNTKFTPPPLPIDRPIKATHACPTCKTAMMPKAKRKGSFAIEVILLVSSIFFLIAFFPIGLLGLIITAIYSLSRATNRKKVCANCGNPHIVSLKTLAGQQLQKQLAPQYQNTKYPLPFFLKAFLGFSAFILILILTIVFLTDQPAPPNSSKQPRAAPITTQTNEDPQPQPAQLPEPEPLLEKTLITETETHYWYQMPDGTTKRIEKQP